MNSIDPGNRLQEDKELVEKMPSRSEDDQKRRARITANDLENIPIHLGVFWSAFVVQGWSNLCQKGENETVALTGLFIIYTVSRVFHTVCYLAGINKPPLRSIFFIFGVLSVFCSLAISIKSSFDVDFKKIGYN